MKRYFACSIPMNSHSIIAAGAVVTRDVEDYSVVGGVPARYIKSRTSVQ